MKKNAVRRSISCKSAGLMHSLSSINGLSCSLQNTQNIFRIKTTDITRIYFFALVQFLTAARFRYFLSFLQRKHDVYIALQFFCACFSFHLLELVLKQSTSPECSSTIPQVPIAPFSFPSMHSWLTVLLSQLRSACTRMPCEYITQLPCSLQPLSTIPYLMIFESHLVF